jgi:hypothetical protein
MNQSTIKSYKGGSTIVQLIKHRRMIQLKQIKHSNPSFPLKISDPMMYNKSLLAMEVTRHSINRTKDCFRRNFGSY